MPITEHEVFLAYAPRGAGLLCAVCYFKQDSGIDLCGWWIGFKDHGYIPAYFTLQNFYTLEDTAFLATEGSDLYGGWRYDYSRSQPLLGSPLRVDDALAHRLEQLQELFFREWLFDRTDPGASEELAWYAAEELAVQDLNIQHQRLNKLDRHGAVWIYRSHGLDGQVIDYLSARWPLDYGKE